MKIKITKIKYADASPEELKHLPKTMTIEVDDDEIDCATEEPRDDDELIEDIITEKTDFCVSSFEVKSIGM